MKKIILAALLVVTLGCSDMTMPSLASKGAKTHSYTDKFVPGMWFVYRLYINGTEFGPVWSQYVPEDTNKQQYITKYYEEHPTRTFRLIDPQLLGGRDYKRDLDFYIKDRNVDIKWDNKCGAWVIANTRDAFELAQPRDYSFACQGREDVPPM